MMERLMTLLLPALAGIDLVNLTALGTKMSMSLEQLVIDDIVLSIVARGLRGIEVNEVTLALELIDRVGPAGDFMTEDHTLQHFRDELLIPELVNRETYPTWRSSGAPDFQDRAVIKVRQLLAEHKP